MKQVLARRGKVQVDNVPASFVEYVLFAVGLSGLTATPG